MNLVNRDKIRAGTVAGYMKSVNALFVKRNLPAPIDLKNKKDKVAILISNLKSEEAVANQRNPFTPQMVAEFIRRGNESDHMSLPSLVKDIIISGREIGYRASETCQTNSTLPDYHVYPNGNKVIKALCEDWWTGYDANGNIVPDVVKDKDKVVKMVLTWFIQKNRRNKEKVTYVRNANNSEPFLPLYLCL